MVKVEWEPVVQEPSLLGDIAHYLMMPMLFLLPFSADDDDDDDDDDDSMANE